MNGAIVFPPGCSTSKLDLFRYFFEEHVPNTKDDDDVSTISFNICGGPNIMLYCHFGAKTTCEAGVAAFLPTVTDAIREVHPVSYASAQLPAPGPTRWRRGAVLLHCSARGGVCASDRGGVG